MSDHNQVSHYGVRHQVSITHKADEHIEEIISLGYTVVKSGFSKEKQAEIVECFEKAFEAQAEKYGGLDYLKQIDEHNTIRCPLQHSPIFIDILQHSLIMEICSELIGPYVVLNQQNGIINPPNKEKYNQGSYHRDLPYQHFTSSHPLAINALYAIDPFTKENGATFVIPASHKSEAFPSDTFIKKHEIQIEADPGDYIVLDCMLYHSGGVNQTGQKRRAVNNVYSIPMMKQQVNLPAVLNGMYQEDESLRQLLGYDVQIPDDIAAYYKTREK